MQCEDLEVEMSTPRLDEALHELDLLSSRTPRTPEYLREIQNNTVLNMLSINTRYVSNVSIGFRVRPVAPHVRFKPYALPRREERNRTKSENNDNGESTSIVKAVLDETVSISFEEATLKKAKSLENIVLENNKDVDLCFKIPEVEIVSDRIQNLRVVE